MKQAIKLVFYYFIYQVAATFLAMAGYYGWYFIVHGTLDAQGGLPLNVSLSANLIAILVFGWQLISNKYVTINRQTLNPGKPTVVFSYILLGISSLLWMNYLSDKANLPDWFEDLFIDMKSTPFGIISICLIAPIFEEMLFRGAIEGHLLKKLKNPANAILISALLFGLIHGNPAQLLFAFCFGLVLGFVYFRTRSLSACIILHFINNSTATALMIFFPEYDSISEIFGKGIIIPVAVVSFIISIIAFKMLKKSTSESFKLFYPPKL